MSVGDKSTDPIKYQEQHVANREHDEDAQAKRILSIESLPTDSTKNNPAYNFSYTADELTQLDMIIDGTTYRRAITWTNNNITALSDWSEV